MQDSSFLAFLAAKSEARELLRFADIFQKRRSSLIKTRFVLNKEHSQPRCLVSQSAVRNRFIMVRVAFIHPDLGIGGAERLVIDAAWRSDPAATRWNFTLPTTTLATASRRPKMAA